VGYMISLPTKYEISVSAHYEERRYKMWKTGATVWGKGRSWSLEIATFDRVHTSSY